MKEEHFKEINNQKEKLDNIVAAIGASTWEWNVQTDEVLITQSFADLCGYSLDELQPMTIQKWEGFLHPDDREHHKKIVFDHIEGRKPNYECDCRLIHKSGEVVWIHSRGKIISYDNAGLPLWIYGTDQDISTIKNIQVINNQNLKLESVGVLAGGIAHEFNNILTGVFGYVELALLRTNDEKAKKFLNASIASINKAKLLSSKLLVFAEGDKLIIQSQQIEYFIRKTVTSIITDKAYSLSFQSLNDIWPVFYDKNQIHNVLANIIQNSIEAMPNGGHITVSALNVCMKYHNALTPGNYVKISISDNGTGISQEKLDRIYDPFYTTKTQNQGLGLTIAFNIIKNHNGLIEIETEENSGTTTIIYLPADVDFAEHEIPASLDELSADKEKILIFEENDTARDIYVNIFPVLGYDVIVSYEIEQTLNLYKQFKDDNLKAVILHLSAIITANRLVSLVDDIKNIDNNAHIFISSANSNDPIMREPTKYGFVDSISKPFTISDIAEKFDKIFKPNK
jgi:PAS domain S-box-containing protein